MVGKNNALVRTVQVQEKHKEIKMDKLSGKRQDDGKPRMALLSPIAMEEIAKVLTFGAEKYGDNNWRGGFKWTRVANCLLRHIFAWLRGEDKDKESGLSHLAHAGCNIMFLLEFEHYRLGEDDRWTPPKSTDLPF